MLAIETESVLTSVVHLEVTVRNLGMKEAQRPVIQSKLTVPILAHPVPSALKSLSRKASSGVGEAGNGLFEG